MGVWVSFRTFHATASFGEVQLQGDLGCKLDSLADSYIVLEVHDGGSIARWNASNPNKKINKGRAENNFLMILLMIQKSG